jgi:hypothetical protein
MADVSEVLTVSIIGEIIKVVITSDTSLNFYHSTQQNNTEDSEALSGHVCISPSCIFNQFNGVKPSRLVWSENNRK